MNKDLRLALLEPLLNRGIAQKDINTVVDDIIASLTKGFEIIPKADEIGKIIESDPVLVGTLTCTVGAVGCNKAYPDHPVFEFKDSYIVYLTSKSDSTKRIAAHYPKDSPFKKFIKFY